MDLETIFHQFLDDVRPPPEALRQSRARLEQVRELLGTHPAVAAIRPFGSLARDASVVAVHDADVLDVLHPEVLQGELSGQQPGSPDSAVPCLDWLLTLAAERLSSSRNSTPGVPGPGFAMRPPRPDRRSMPCARTHPPPTVRYPCSVT